MVKSKTKGSKKAQPSQPVSSVKKASVTKPTQTTKAKSKEMAKSVAKKVVKETKKKAVKPESSDDSSEEKASDSSDSEDESDVSDSSSGSDSEEVKMPAAVAKANGKAKAQVKAESSDSESDSDFDEAETEAKASGSAKAAAVSSDSSNSDSDADSDSDDKKPTAAKAAASDDSEADSDDSDDSEDDSDDSDDSSSESAEAAPVSKKRKADSEIDATPKKAKTDNIEAASTLFVGSLSWGTDDSALWEAFKEFEGIVNARVVTDKISGKSRGFGYLDFSDSDAATKAYKAMQGHELDGRTLNLDYANARTTDANPRDRAADRAKKHGDSISPESDTLFVGNLPFGVDQDSVREFFAASREVASVRLPTDPETGNLKGFGYVSFNSVEDAKGALQELNGVSIGDGQSARSVRLDYASSRPPREGGGFGGSRGGGSRGRGGDRGRGRRGSRGGPRGGAGFSGTKISFD